MEKFGFSLLDLGANYHEKSLLVMGSTNKIIKIPFIGVIIKTEDLTLLFDTGPNITGKYPIMKRFSTEQKNEQSLEYQLKLLNLRISDIDLVVISHLHFDHAGGLTKFRNTGIPILIQKKELDYAYNPDWFYTDVYYRNDFDFNDLSYEPIKGDYQINSDLETISLNGHTPGTQGLLYNSKSRKIIFTSDAIYTMENIFPKLTRQGFDYCTSMWGKSANKVILKNRISGFEIYPGHDPEFYSKKKFAPYVY